MPTPEELKAANALAQPLDTASKIDLPFLWQALRIVGRQTLLMPTPVHLTALANSRMYWQQQALTCAELLVSATSCIEDPVGLALQAAQKNLADLRDLAAQENNSSEETTRDETLRRTDRR